MVTTERAGCAAPLGISRHADHCCGLCTSQPGRAVDSSSPRAICVAPSGTVCVALQKEALVRGNKTLDLKVQTLGFSGPHWTVLGHMKSLF